MMILGSKLKVFLPKSAANKTKKMNKYKLPFISDADLFNHVKETVEKYRFKINFKEFNKNIIDPIKLTFDSKIYKKSLKDIVDSEILRQLDKSNTNHIGYFHQNIFKYFNKEWTVPAKGFDVVNNKKKIYIELKNKHNTMNSSSSQKTFTRMQSAIIKDPDVICMLVEVIAKKKYLGSGSPSNQQNLLVRWLNGEPDPFILLTVPEIGVGSYVYTVPHGQTPSVNTSVGYRNTISADYIRTTQGGSGFGYTIGISTAPLMLLPVNVSVSIPEKK